MRKSFVIVSLGLILGSTTTMAQAHVKKKCHHKPCKVAAIQAPIMQKDEGPQPINAENDKIWIDNLSGYLTVVSNYMFRGISQTRNLPALQGSLTYGLPYGIYLNMWGSNVRFEDSPATVEFDSVIGVRNTIGEKFSFDINAARYNYPGARLSNYNEINSVFNYDFLQAGLSYSGNVYNSHTGGTYYNGGINYAIPSEFIFHIDNVSILALFGHYSLNRAAGNSYNDYNIMLSKKIKNYTFAAQWTDTNGRANSHPYDGSTFIGQVTANF